MILEVTPRFRSQSEGLGQRKSDLRISSTSLLRTERLFSFKIIHGHGIDFVYPKLLHSIYYCVLEIIVAKPGPYRQITVSQIGSAHCQKRFYFAKLQHFYLL